MEKEIRDSLINSSGAGAADLVRKFCRETVTDELMEMLNGGNGLADIVFRAAEALRDEALGKIAAKNIIASQGYDQKIRRRASALLNELSMR